MADISLAAIPLTAKVLLECLNGYKIFTEAKNLGRDSQKLLSKFKIQEARLRIWAREWGLLDQTNGREDDVRETCDYDIARETLHRISELFTDYNRLQTRYRLALATDTHDVPFTVCEHCGDDVILINIKSRTNQLI
jgi:HET-S-like prion-inhibition and propagation protein